MPAQATTQATTPIDDASGSAFTTKADRALALTKERLARLRGLLEEAGVGFEDRVRDLDVVALDLEQLKARLLAKGSLYRFTHVAQEEAQLQSLTKRIDAIVEA